MKPEEQLFLQEKLKEERKCSDEAYAIKLVERVVFVLVGTICLAFIAFLLKKVWPS